VFSVALVLVDETDKTDKTDKTESNNNLLTDSYLDKSWQIA
jgi:hypothetical protein